MSKSLALIAALALQIPTLVCAKAPQKVVERLEVDGYSFKVVWKGDQATVTRRAMFFTADAKMHVAAIKAAERVSGCKADKDFSPGIGVVTVILECPNGSADALSSPQQSPPER